MILNRTDLIEVHKRLDTKTPSTRSDATEGVTGRRPDACFVDVPVHGNVSRSQNTIARSVETDRDAVAASF